MSKLYCCVMEKITESMVNVAKTTLWQSNESSSLKYIEIREGALAVGEKRFNTATKFNEDRFRLNYVPIFFFIQAEL